MTARAIIFNWNWIPVHCFILAAHTYVYSRDSRRVPWFLARENTMKLHQNRRQNVARVCVTPLSCKIQSIARQLCMWSFVFFHRCVDGVCVRTRSKQISSPKPNFIHNNHRKWFNAKIYWLNRANLLRYIYVCVQLICFIHRLNWFCSVYATYKHCLHTVRTLYIQNIAEFANKDIKHREKE